MKKCLIIAPHQDDEVIGCGGVMLKLIKNGWEVKVFYVFSGNSGCSGLSPAKSEVARETEAEAAAKSGGWQLLGNLKIADRSDVSVQTLTRALVNVIREYEPDVIFSPHENESDFEHSLTSKAVREASWLAGAFAFPDAGKRLEKNLLIVNFEVWTPLLNPTFCVDISEFMKKKQEIIRLFTSQVSLTNWDEGIIGLNAYRGTISYGKGHAEAYSVNKTTLNVLIGLLNDLT